MSILARCGSVVLLIGVLAGTTVFAQDAPEAGGSWTDPPARGAAGPAGKPDGAKPDSVKPGAPAAPSPAAQAPSPTPDKPVAKTATSPAPAQAHRTFAIRRYAVPIKRLAVRPRVIAAAPVAKSMRSARSPWGYRLRVAARHERAVRHARREDMMIARRDESRVAAHARRRHLASAHARRYARDYAYAMPYAEPAAPPVYARRAGWGGLVDDDRAYRIAQARAAGYRVMRLRTYAYPGGPVGELIPYDRGDLD